MSGKEGLVVIPGIAQNSSRPLRAGLKVFLEADAPRVPDLELCGLCCAPSAAVQHDRPTSSSRNLARASAPSCLLLLQALLTSSFAQRRGRLLPSCLLASLRGPWLPPLPSSRSGELKLEMGFASACTIYNQQHTG